VTTLRAAAKALPAQGAHGVRPQGPPAA